MWRSLAARAERSRAGYEPGTGFLLDVQVFVSGDVWQHGRSGVQLGHIGRTSHSLWVQIYVRDEVSSRAEATAFFAGALADAAERVRDRLVRRAPDWPADQLVAELASLTDAFEGGPAPTAAEADV